MGEIHELFVLDLSLVWFAGATPDTTLVQEGPLGTYVMIFGRGCRPKSHSHFHFQNSISVSGVMCSPLFLASLSEDPGIRDPKIDQQAPKTPQGLRSEWPYTEWETGPARKQ